MRVHFISIGGAVMHHLAIELKNKGHKVSGSDDHIEDPSRSRLESEGLLPEKPGWDPGRISDGLDLILLGMHARKNNPELQRALELGIPVKSFPEFLYEQTRNKKRVVIGGSHGKTTITAMVMHVLKASDIPFDYMIGSDLEGFDQRVSLGENTTIAVFEGDEYLSSALDDRPKFLLYKPHIALVTGIAWDHANVFPDEESYYKQFDRFIESIEEGGRLIYCSEDLPVCTLIEKSSSLPRVSTYNTHGYFQNRKGFFAATHNRVVPLEIFGRHNMQNLSAAREVCLALGVTEDAFYEKIRDFKGASRRLECLLERNGSCIYHDFAHAPSKVQATIEAVAERFPSRKIIAILELHTYSSLNRQYLPQYRGSMDQADKGLVYFNPAAVKRKGLPPLSEQDIRKAMGQRPALSVHHNVHSLEKEIRQHAGPGKVFLFMSSASFAGIDLHILADELCP